MRTTAKVYRSFEEFEREELRCLSSLHAAVDEMLDDSFVAELDFDPDFVAKSKRREEAEEEDDKD